MSQYHRVLPQVAAHDLNGVLHALGTFVELAEGAADPATAREHLRMVRACVSRLRELSETLQGFEHLGDSAAAFDARELCAGLGERVNAFVELPADPVAVLVAPATLERALSGLLLRARRQGRGKVRLAIAREPSGAVITVEDDGPPPAVGRDLDPFAEGAPAGLARGLELLLVRGLVERGGARLMIGKSTLGGSRYELHLPRAPA